MVEGEKVVGELIVEGCVFVEIYVMVVWNGWLVGVKGGVVEVGVLVVCEVMVEEMVCISYFLILLIVLVVGWIVWLVLVVGELDCGFMLVFDGV